MQDTYEKNGHALAKTHTLGYDMLENKHTNNHKRYTTHTHTHIMIMQEKHMAVINMQIIIYMYL